MHRLLLTAAIALSLTAEQNNLREIYKLKFTVTPQAGEVHVAIDVADRETGRVVWSPKLVADPGAWETLTTTSGPHDIQLRVRGQLDGSAEMFIDVKEKGEYVQRNLYTYSPKDAAAEVGRGIYKGEPMSLNLKNADLRDVLRVFGELTGLEVAVQTDIEGKRVSIEVEEVPWDDILQRIATQTGLKITVDEKVIRVE